MLNFHIISIFPESFESYLNSSILKRAQTAGLIRIHLYHLRDFTLDKHRNVDGRPYGGGPGMVMAVEPIIRAVEAIQKKISKSSSGLKVYPVEKNSNFSGTGDKSQKLKAKVILFAPGGKEFNNKIAEKIVKSKAVKHLILICGHYEGIDARVKKILKAEEYTIGPYVLTGGELPAMTMIDAITRRIPGALGNDISLEEKRESASEEMYTRPEIFAHNGKNFRVPKVFLSGHHKKIEEYKQAKKKR